jgi:hypothetical protein
VPRNHYSSVKAQGLNQSAFLRFQIYCVFEEAVSKEMGTIVLVRSLKGVHAYGKYGKGNGD